MVSTPLDIYIETVKSAYPSTPAMMDEMNICILLSRITGRHIMSYEDLVETNMMNIFIYDIPEDKKEFNIETVKRCTTEMELKPYE